MKKILLLLVLLLSLTSRAATSNNPIENLLNRILPTAGDADRFEWTLSSDHVGDDYFTISCDGEKVKIEGNNNVAIATGINWYLQHYAGINISWNNPKDKLPATLKTIPEERHEVSVDKRYYLNFCTHSYTMAFWNWERWQQEIDWMALHGINLPLIITGMESVWKEVLMNGYGYTSLDQVNEFVTGSAYYGWFFMNNMTSWGGPQTENWYKERTELAKQIFTRLSEYGMTPVIPGYVGMIPEKFMTYSSESKRSEWKSSDIVNGGTWNSFTRPYFVNNTTRLKEFAEKYYAAINTIFGDVLSTHYYAIDPFHEGGVPSGVTDAKSSVKAMYDGLLNYDSDAIWVAQHWLENPTELLTHTVPANKLIILNLHGESSGDTECSGYHTTESGENHQWVWGMVSNFGGNVGLFGRVSRIINSFYASVKNKDSNKLVGVGAIPEGIENNPMLYDLLYAMPWTSEDYTLTSWINDYVTMRYGVTKESDADTYKTLVSAWTRIVSGIYNCQSDGQQGTTESVFMQRPSKNATTVSSWAGSSWYWDIEDLRSAAYEFKSVSDKLKDNNNFQYDYVDIMRQALADYGKQTLDSIASLTGDKRKSVADRFLSMILNQDKLLGTRSEFRLGRWTDMARALGTTEDEKNLYEKNARMLITTWGSKAQCNSGGLHDYANREWNGLLSSYYYPRWKAYFENNFRDQEWFDNYEWPFATGENNNSNSNYLPENVPYAYGTFSSEAEGEAVATANEIYDQYFSEFTPRVWEKFTPNLEHSYAMSNVNAWYNSSAPGTEGLTVIAPNTDYPSGYRLKRMALSIDDQAFQWRFETSQEVKGAYKIKNMSIDAANYGSYLCSTPSSDAYPAFTFSKEGNSYFIYRCGNEYYIQDANNDVYMSPDCAWAEACVLVSQMLGSSSYVSLVDLNQDVKVRFVSTEGENIGIPEEVLPNGTTSYSNAPLEVNNHFCVKYQINKHPAQYSNIATNIQRGDSLLTFYYGISTEDAKTVVIKYVDASGKELKEPVVLYGVPTDSLIEAAYIDDYSCKSYKLLTSESDNEEETIEGNTYKTNASAYITFIYGSAVSTSIGDVVILKCCSPNSSVNGLEIYEWVDANQTYSRQTTIGNEHTALYLMSYANDSTKEDGIYLRNIRTGNYMNNDGYASTARTKWELVASPNGNYLKVYGKDEYLGANGQWAPCYVTTKSDLDNRMTLGENGEYEIVYTISDGRLQVGTSYLTEAKNIYNTLLLNTYTPSESSEEDQTIGYINAIAQHWYDKIVLSIDDIEGGNGANKDDKNIYDMQGRYVNNPHSGELYIKGGQIFIQP